MASNSAMAKKLQNALNMKGLKILLSQTQFYSEQQDRAVTMYSIKKAVWDEEKQKNMNIELFKTTSHIQVVLYLRDLWYEVNGLEIPTDNEMWNKIKERMEGMNNG